MTLLVLLAGLTGLWVGGEQFVIGATRLSERTRIPTILVGIVIAGFGTSTPELTVSVLASLRDEGGVALGNVLGSNIANVLLVLPLSALAMRWTAREGLVRREVGAVLGATALLTALAAGGTVSRVAGGVLVATFAGVIVWISAAALKVSERREIEAEIEELVGPPGALPEAARAVIGLAFVLVSADRVVWAAGRLAAQLGLSEAAIGLTLVALGTSLPEVVTAVAAARHGEADLVLGNVLGSNLFNALLVAGCAALAGPLTITGSTLAIALGGAAFSAALLALFLFPGYRLTRVQALVGLGAYAAFVVWLSV